MRAKNNLAYSSLRFVLIELIGDVIYWPLWWYSRGLIKVATFCLHEISNREDSLGLCVWTKNIFTPMFGQYDWEGRLISFFVRLIQIIFRAIVLFLFSILMLAIILAWLLAPIYVFYQVVENFVWFTQQI